MLPGEIAPNGGSQQMERHNGLIIETHHHLCQRNHVQQCKLQDNLYEW